MTAKSTGVNRLKTTAAKAAVRAAAAKVQVRLAKSELKRARKIFKAAKKAAKQAQRQLDAARTVRPARPAATLKLKAAIRKPRPAGKPVRALKTAPPKAIASKRTAKKPVAPRASKARASKARASKARASKARASKARASEQSPMRSAAEIAKSVIDRLHAPPPILPLAAVIPPDANSSRVDSTPGTQSGS
jgi:hypothetical protein